jgi:hypothetical protein
LLLDSGFRLARPTVDAVDIDCLGRLLETNELLPTVESDDAHTVFAHGAFFTGVGNVYRRHEAVECARDWDGADEGTV